MSVGMYLFIYVVIYMALFGFDYLCKSRDICVLSLDNWDSLSRSSLERNRSHWHITEGIWQSDLAVGSQLILQQYIWDNDLHGVDCHKASRTSVPFSITAVVRIMSCDECILWSFNTYLPRPKKTLSFPIRTACLADSTKRQGWNSSGLSPWRPVSLPMSHMLT